MPKHNNETQHMLLIGAALILIAILAIFVGDKQTPTDLSPLIDTIQVDTTQVDTAEIEFLEGGDILRSIDTTLDSNNLPVEKKHLYKPISQQQKELLLEEFRQIQLQNKVSDNHKFVYDTNSRARRIVKSYLSLSYP